MSRGAVDEGDGALGAQRGEDPATRGDPVEGREGAGLG